jgi:hypothetical protein
MCLFTVNHFLIGHHPGGVSGLCELCSCKGFDGIIAVNRVKPHTSFKGDIESGLAENAVGRIRRVRPGAAAVHAQGIKGLRNMVPSIGTRS